LSQNKNIALQQKIIKEKLILADKVKTFRANIRKQKKIQDAAKLKKDGDEFVKAAHKIAKFKNNFKLQKTNLKNVALRLKHVKASLKDNKSTLVKITGKKQLPINRGAHSMDRVNSIDAKITFRYAMINKLQARFAKVLAFLKFAKKSHNEMGNVFRQHLIRRAHRLAKRLHRRHKLLMKTLIRKVRVAPYFKGQYKSIEKNIFKLTRADIPKIVTKKDKLKVMKLKEKVQKLFQLRKKLMGEKHLIMLKVRKARMAKNAAKAIKKSTKKNVKAQESKPVSNVHDIKKVKVARKKLEKKRFVAKMAKLSQKAAQEHKTNIRHEDHKVAKDIKKMAKEIKNITGIKFKKPSIIAAKTFDRIRVIK